VSTGRRMSGPAAEAWRGDGDDVAADRPGLEDAELLRQVAAGDKDAMGELYRRHGEVLFAQIRFVAGDLTLSEETFQDTMVAIWRGAASFRGESKARSRMIAIAHRQARVGLRRRRLRVVDDAFLAALPSLAPGPEHVALDRAEAAAVISAIKALDPAHREVLGLAVGAGLVHPEIAEILQVPVGTVKSRISAARAALIRALSKEGYAR
jgi:RNA polymerase sigma-70 factor, ECF subfamily